MSRPPTRALRLLDLAPGEMLLVEGASGGVGTVDVQLALARGIRVVDTVSPANHALLVELGARPTTYVPGLRDRVTADAALDCAGARSLAELRAITDRVVTIADLTAAEHGVRLTWAGSGDPDGRAGLADGAGMADRGRLRIPTPGRRPRYDGAAAPLAPEEGRGAGKVLLVL